MTANKLETDAKGIPLKSPYPPAFTTSMLPFFVVIYTVTGVLGQIIAYVWAYKVGNPSEKVESKIATVQEYDLGYIYAGFVVVHFVKYLILYPMLANARLQCRLHNPDQHAYKVQGAEGSKLGYVLMETEGSLGVFNRAQRAFQNFNENFPSFMLMWLCCSWVFPFESFVCLLLWLVIRIYYNVLYVDNPESRSLGTALGDLVQFILHGMCLIIAVKSLTKLSI